MSIKAIAMSMIMAGVGAIISRTLQPPTPASMARHAVRALTLIRSAGPHGMTEGSGFFIADHMVVTSYHVIEDLRGIVVETYTGRRFRVQRVVAASRRQDFAVLSIAATAPVTLVPCLDARAGDDVFTLGAPLGMADSLSRGIVSQLRRGPSGEPLIQHTAPISPGSSGGPLLDAYGNVLGINNFFVDEGQNVNFALDIGVVMGALGKRPRRRQGLLSGAYDFLDHVRSRIGVEMDWQESTKWQYMMRQDGDSERRHFGVR